LTLKGEFGERAVAVTAFSAKLQSKTPLPIEMWDERFTSAIAERARIDAGIKKKGRRDKRKVDEMAAVVLLQSFLESRRRREMQQEAP
jgi:putative Holliday junction resolvase